MKKVIPIILSVVILIGLGGWYLVKEADASEPGDLLYPVDIAAEAVERLVTFDDVALAEFEQEVLEERVEELDALVTKETVDEELILGATEKVSSQRSKVQEHIESGEATQEGSMEQVQNRYEVKAEEHIQVMEKVQNKSEEAGTQEKAQSAAKSYTDSISGNSSSDSSGSSSGNGNGN